MRYALIGCGRISPNHLAAAKNNGLEIVAVCDPVLERMEQRLAQAEITANRYTSYEEMLKQEKPELVAIATESGRHAPIALDCLHAGCNIMIEKPIALSMADAREIVRAGAEAKRVVSVCHQNRFNKAVRQVHAALENGRFGRLLHGTAQIRWNRNEDYYRQAPWRGTWAQDGGALMNQCIHNIDLLRWMLGDDVQEVMAYTDRLNHPYIEAEDLGLAILRFSNGAYGMIEGTTNVYPKNLEETLCLFGQDGTVKVGGKSTNAIENWQFRDGLDDPEEIKARYSETPPNIYGFGHTPLYADVIAAIQEGRKPFVDAQAGLRAMELVLAIYLSAATGKPVQLPLSDCASTDFTGRFDR